MNHQGTKTIETKRLILRRFTMEDGPAMYHNWASDPEVTRFLTWPTHSSEEVSRQVLLDWTAQYEDKAFYQWAIVPRAFGEPVGSIGAVGLNEQAQLVPIGYCIGANWWHQGITSEAMQAVMDFFFDEVGVNRVESRHDPNNPNYGAVMRKCGMTFEGTLCQSDWNNQGICDAVYYGLLREEYTGK